MISWIKGELVSSWQANNKFYILLNCRGLGYEIQTLRSVINDINEKIISEKEIILWIKHIKKEDSDMLFCFNSKEQRDFFIQILNIKGILNRKYNWNYSKDGVNDWVNGKTKESFVNSNMLELKNTGWMSNRGRQNVASYLAKELKIYWRR